MRLEGKTAIVTGGANGIGRATVKTFVREGARVAVADLDEPRMASLVEELGAAVLPVRCDLTDSGSVKAMVATTLAAFGRLDILVNCAGGSGMSPFYKTDEGKALRWTEEIPEREWDASLDLNLKAVFLCCKHALPAMKQQGSGRIVNFSSIAHQVGRPDSTFAYAAYAAAKAGVTGLTRHLAAELGQFGITVNCVCPGSVLSERMVERYTNDPVWKETSERTLRQLTPLGRAGYVEELAAAVLYLASDEASYVTGVTLDVNGGRYMK